MRTTRTKTALLPALSARAPRVGRGSGGQAKRSLDDQYRNGGAISEDREWGRDLVTEMTMLSGRPDWLASELRSMGVTPDGDEVLDD